MEEPKPHEGTSDVMSTYEVEQLIDKIEKNMKRDLIISSDFSSIDRKRRKTMLFFIFLNCFFTVCSLIAAVAKRDSSLHYYSLNPFYGYGFLGKFFSAFYAFGYAMCVSHAFVYFRNEGNGTLTIVTNMKAMVRKISNPSSLEIRHLTFFLKAMRFIREVGFFVIVIPLIVIRAVGVADTAYRLNSWEFAIASFPIFVLFCISVQNACHIYEYTHLILAHLMTCVRLRLKRTDNNLLYVLSLTQTRSRRLIRSQLLNFINSTIGELNETINEMKQDNQCVKFWLRDGLYGMGAVYASCLVFILGDIGWYFKVIIIGNFFGLVFVLAASFSNIALVHTRTQKLAKRLHSCQTKLQVDISMKIMNCSVFNDTAHYSMIIKTKFQILRMIHKITSPSLKTGFTVGDGESFSFVTAAAFITETAGTSVMFMNWYRRS